jgi:DNA repair exonuclease SbcCD ATPase subunit
MKELQDAVKHIQLSADNEADREWGEKAASQLKQLQAEKEHWLEQTNVLELALDSTKSYASGLETEIAAKDAAIEKAREALRDAKSWIDARNVYCGCGALYGEEHAKYCTYLEVCQKIVAAVAALDGG